MDAPPRIGAARALLWLAGGGLLACAEAPHELHAKLERGPVPLVLILVDTLRADHLGCYGYDRPTSPRLDAFAADAVRFERCLAQSTWTRPATASLHTGLYPSRHGVSSVFTVLDEPHETLAEILQGQGYRTAAIGSNPHVFDGTGFDQGFDTFESLKVTDERLSYARAGVLVDRALEWLAAAPEDEPFFLYLHLFDPHAPYDPPEPYRGAFDRGVRGEKDAWYMLRNGMQAADLTEEEWSHYVDLYDGEIAYADAEIGRLLDALDLDRTAVVVVSDHGEELFDHGGWSHTPTMYAEIVSVPLIASFPSLRAAGVRGASVEDLALQVDLVPTMLDVLGLEPRPDLPGRTLIGKALRAAPPTPFGLSEVDEFGQYKKAVLAGDWKYIRTWSPAPGEELFDLASDPAEGRNALDARPDAAPPLRRILDDHLDAAPGRYSVSFENRSDAMTTLTGLIVTEVGRVEGSDLVGCEFEHEGATDWDGPFLFLEEERDGVLLKAVQFTLRTAPGDTDGFMFTPVAGEERVRLYCLLNDTPLEPAWVHVGAAGEHLDANPLELDLRAPQRYASRAAPAPPGGDAPYALSVWNRMDAAGRTNAPSERTQRLLRKLGYGGH